MILNNIRQSSTGKYVREYNYMYYDLKCCLTLQLKSNPPDNNRKLNNLALLNYCF